MAALTEERQTDERNPALREPPVAAGATIYAGAGVVLNAGNAEPASTATGRVTIGRAEETVDNSGGAAGDKTVKVKRGCFRYANSAGADEIALDDVESDCYWVDDQTVALTNGGATRSVAGKIFDVDSDGVWVELG